MDMSSQDNIKVSPAEYDSCINVPLVDNNKCIAFTINPYDYYNNRFFEGENGQHFDNQSVNHVKEWTQKANFLPRDANVCRNSLQVGLFHPTLDMNSYTGKSFPNGHKTICIPSKMIMPSVRFENDGENRGHRECTKDMSESSLTRLESLEDIAQYDMPVYSRKQKIDGKSIVVLTAKTHILWNRAINEYLWCPFVLIVLFFCCAPVRLMVHKSYIAFRKGRDSEARRWAICSFVFYGIGWVLAPAMIFALVLIYTK